MIYIKTKKKTRHSTFEKIITIFSKVNKLLISLLSHSFLSSLLLNITISCASDHV